MALSLGWTSMQRDRQPEVMDQPGLDPAEHDRALQGLRRINGISRCVPGLFRQFEALACENPSTQLSVLEPRPQWSTNLCHELSRQGDRQREPAQQRVESNVVK